MHDAATLIAELRAYVADERVLEAIAAVPRERFVSPGLRDRAYENSALSIGCGQTISQPLVVARMSEMLAPRPDDRVLDVGTGSGYHAAVLAQLAAHVWSIERHGTRGLPEHGPFDAINVAAAGSADALSELEAQLAPGGRLVAPVSGEQQRLVVTRRTPAGLERRLFEEVRFVPLVRDG
jgi:protein-L-isoaspartate(D-aspartate) O-methyltransferase